MNKSASIKQHYPSNPIPKLQQTSLGFLFVNLTFKVRSWAEDRFLLTLLGPEFHSIQICFLPPRKLGDQLQGLWVAPTLGCLCEHIDKTMERIAWGYWDQTLQSVLILLPPCKSWWNLPSIPFFSWSFQMELLSSHHLLFRD